MVRKKILNSTVLKILFSQSSIFLLLIFFTVKPSFGAVVYMPDDFPNLRAATAGMAGGDTLIIRNGSYLGTDNILSQSQVPPSGTSKQYTIIKAENDGKAVFPDGFLVTTAPVPLMQYIQFEGIKALRHTEINGASYIKFLRCAFTTDYQGSSSESAFIIYGGGYILVEDSWAWGAGRYKMLATGNAHHIIFRRCVVRFDRVHTNMPISFFHAYGADQVAFQNSIGIDGDHPEFWIGYSERAPVFYSHSGAVDTIIDGSIGINNQTYFAGGRPSAGFTVRNSVVWDSSAGIYSRNDDLPNGFLVDHVTIGNIIGDVSGTSLATKGYGIQTGNGIDGKVVVKNSIIYNTRNNGNALHGYPLRSSSSSHNVLYDNTNNYLNCTVFNQDYSAENSNAINPIIGSPGNGIAALKYLIKIEDGSNLDGTASEGGDRGATIIHRIGTSGTLWGESGWDTVTDEPLWPWPNEERIKSDMGDYSYTGPIADPISGEIIIGATGTLSGNRGFCQTGQTLSNYIWGYLGNTVPPFNVKASSGDGSVTLKWDSPAPIALPTITGYKIYNVTNNTVTSVAESGTLTATVSGLASGTTYEFYVTAIDSVKGESSYSYKVYVTPSGAVIPPPAPTGFVIRRR